MKIPPSLLFGLGLLPFLLGAGPSSCGPSDSERLHGVTPYRSPVTRYLPPDPVVVGQSEPASTAPVTADPPPPPPVLMEAPKVATPVPGRPGFVYPPGSSDPEKIVDVRGLTPGAEVMDPYTSRTFIVP